MFVEVGPAEGVVKAEGFFAFILLMRLHMHFVVVSLVLFAVVAHMSMALVVLAARRGRVRSICHAFSCKSEKND